MADTKHQSILIPPPGPIYHPDTRGLDFAAIAGSIQGVTCHRASDESRIEGDANIFMLQRVYDQVMEHLSSDVSREQGGILLGYALKTETPTVWIVHSLPARHTEGSATQLKFLTQSWIEFDQIEQQFATLTLERIGWYHSHPNIAIYLSQWDLNVCKDFDKTYHVALVVDPIQQKGAFFVRGSTGYQPRTQKGFWEIHDHSPESVVSWKNLVRSRGNREIPVDELSIIPPARIDDEHHVIDSPRELRKIFTARQWDRWKIAAIFCGGFVVALLVSTLWTPRTPPSPTPPIALQAQDVPSSPKPPPQPTLQTQQLRIVPLGSTFLHASESVSFQAQDGEIPDEDVRWRIDPKIGSIDKNGKYSAPKTIKSSEDVTVTASAKNRTTLDASDVVHLEKPAEKPPAIGSSQNPKPTLTSVSPVTVSIEPPTVLLHSGAQQKFTATITGSRVTSVWALDPRLGTIDQAGLYQAPWEIAQRETVKITTTVAPNISASAQVILLPKTEGGDAEGAEHGSVAPTLQISSPDFYNLNAGETFDFKVTSQPPEEVTWTLNEPTSAFGTIDQSGRYTAPNTQIDVIHVKVIATGKRDNQKAIVPINIIPRGKQ